MVKFYEQDDKWFEIRINLEGKDISITGSDGCILSYREALRESKESWISLFENNQEEIDAFNKRNHTKLRSPKSIAEYIMRYDGELSGIEVYKEENGKVYVYQGGGQCYDHLPFSTPELEKLIIFWKKWHMKSSCNEARMELENIFVDKKLEQFLEILE